MGIRDDSPAAIAEKRRKALVILLGIGEAEADDTSIKGRLAIIAKLKAAKRSEISRGQTGSWLYDVNRHLSICACLRKEYEALEEILDGCKSAAVLKKRAGNVIELRP